MHLYYIRHGDPDYVNNCLTELGRKEAELTSQELEKIPFDYIFSSSSNRAEETASYLAKKINKEIISYDWAKEETVFSELSFFDEEVGHQNWIFHSKRLLRRMHELENNPNWYDDKVFLPTVKTGIERVKTAIDEWLYKTLGIQHDFQKNKYISGNRKDLEVAFFAHGGFGTIFTSHILGIAYPSFVNRFHEHQTCGVTHIYIDESGENPPQLISYDVKYNKVIKENN